MNNLLKFEQNYAVSAGAGSGKTKTLVDLYAGLIEMGFSVKEIIAITFTDKAAGELKERIEEKIGSRLASTGVKSQESRVKSQESGVWLRALHEISDAPISTFHTFCARLLQEHPIEAGITPDFNVIDEYASGTILKDVIKKTVLELADSGDRYSAGWIRTAGFQGSSGFLEIIRNTYQNIRNHGFEIRDLRHDIKSGFINILNAVDNNYSKAKREKAYLDFHDLLFLTKRLLLSNKAVRSFYKKAYKKIMVDEFQDTNNLQASIVYLLAEKDEILDDAPSIQNLADSKLIVVGDMKQSIYGFRGADVQVFEDIIKGFGGNDVVHLKDNHRSCKGIVSFVNTLFIQPCVPQDIFNENAAQSHTRKQEDDFDDARVEVMLFGKDKKAKENRKIEADVIAKRIREIIGKLDVWKRGVGKRKAGFSDIAILFRTLNDVALYEESLKNHDIPYYLVRGRGFYNCQEVIDIYNVLHYIEHESHISLAGILRSPFVGLMDETLFRLCRENKGAREISEGFYNEAEFEGYPEGEVEKIARGRELLGKWKSKKDTFTFSELIEQILADTGYLGAVIPTFQGEQKVANIKKLIEAARRFEKAGHTILRDFIRYLKSLLDEPPGEPEAQITTEGMDVVKIMTIHQAKGLEFPVVFIPDVGRRVPSNKDRVVFEPAVGIAEKDVDEDDAEEGSKNFREAKDIIKAKSIQESLRIFYVACTRARDYLVLSKTQSSSKETWGALLDSIMKPEIDEFIESGKSIDEVTIGDKTNVKLKSASSAALDVSCTNNMPKPAPNFKKTPIDVVKDVFDFTPPVPSGLTIAATALADFMACPEGFNLGGFAEQGEGDIQQAMDAGSLIHLVLEKMDYNMAKHVPAGLKQGKDDSYIKSLVHGFSTGWFLQDHELNEIIVCIKNFINNHIFNEIVEADEVYREFPFFMPIQEDGWTLYIKGVIDLLYRKGKDWHVVDYKYSEHKEYENYKNQIKIYSLAVSEGFKCNPESSILFMKGKISVSRESGFDREYFKKVLTQSGKRLCRFVK